MRKKNPLPEFPKLFFSFNGILLAVISCLLFSCQPKENYEVVENPMDGFVPNLTDSLRGASSLTELGCYLFIALKGELSFDELAKFIPDSSTIARIYYYAEAPADPEVIRKVAKKITADLHNEFYETVTKAAMLKVNWAEASLNRILIFQMTKAALEGYEITIESAAGKTHLRASVKCMKVDDRWYIGEDLRFGMR